MKWLRYRFKANEGDYRPVTFPPPGPYWCTGYGEENGVPYSIIVAFLPTGTALGDYWPEAHEIDSEPRAEITYTDRFPKPDWWQERNA